MTAELNRRHGERGRAQAGRVIAVYGAKSGLGTTTVARALARALADDGRVAFAELDARSTRDGRARRDSAPGASPEDRLTLDSLDVAVVRTAEGPWVLEAPPRQRSASAQDVETVGSIIDGLRAQFTLSVVSVGHQLNSRALAVLDACDRVVHVTQLTVPALRASQRCLRLLRGLAVPHDKLWIVINRHGSRESLVAADAGRALRHPVFWRLPDGAGSELDGSVRELAGRVREELAAEAPNVAPVAPRLAD